MSDDLLHVVIDGTVHILGNDVDDITVCGEVGPLSGPVLQKALTLDPVDCLVCLAWPGCVVYRCRLCEWTGTDPQIWRGAVFCPCCNVSVSLSIPA